MKSLISSFSRDAIGSRQTLAASFRRKEVKGFKEMPDYLTKSVPHDASRINIHDPDEIRWWTEEFGVSEAQLAMAIKSVGTSPRIVARHLKRKKYLRADY
jgi:hypothetical protein